MHSGKPERVSRRRFLKTAAVGAASAALAACGAPAQPAPKTDGGAAPAPTTAPAVNTGAKQTVRYLSWWFQEGNRGKTWLSLVKEFNESQKDIEVTTENIPFDDYTTKIIVQSQAGKFDGDLLMATPELAPRMVRSGLLAPLDDVLSSNNIKDLSSAHDFLRKDGHIYGLDMVTVAFGILYNMKRYEEAKITPAKTPEEWIEVSKTLTNRDKQQYGFFMSHLVKEPADFWFQLQQWCMPYDGVWAKGKEPQLTSEPIIKGMKLFKQMYDVAMPQGSDTPTGRRLFTTGAVAQGMFVSAAVGSFKPDAPDLYPLLRSAPIPWASNKSIARIHPMTINAGSPVKDGALEFMKWVYKPETYRKMVEGCEDVIFAQPSAARKEYLDKLEWLKPGYDGVSYVTPFDIVGDFVYNFQELGQIVITHMSNVLTANASVEDEMAAAQKEAQALAGRIK